MDNKLMHFNFTADFSSPNVFGKSRDIESGNPCGMDKNMRLDFYRSSFTGSYYAEGMKRIHDDVNAANCHDDTFLALGLCCSSSSSDISKGRSTTSYTMSSARETDDESSVDLGLSCQLLLGSEDTSQSIKLLSAPSAVFTKDHPMLDLQLSLTTGSPESVIMTVIPPSAEPPMDIDISAENPVPTLDDGSITSCWDLGNCSKPLCFSAATNGFSFDKNTTRKADSVPVTADVTSAMRNIVKNPVTCTSGVANPQQRSSSTKTCSFEGCEKGARGASGLCIGHGGGKRCQKPGCNKGAEGRTIYCKAHGGGRRCQYLGCTKSAEGRTDYCISHGGGRRCSQEGCIRAARGKSGLCIRHGGGKRCQVDNCTKSAEGSCGLCISHGGGKRCKFPECTKGAQGSTLFCKAHGGGKRCTVFGCTKGAEGSTPFCKGHGGGKRCSFGGGGACPKSVHGGTQFCVAHGGGKRCAAPDCTRSARGRTNFCVRHGGGKRCMIDGCGKSAQGSTAFCKAHGGGKRCAWGQPGSKYGADEDPCEHFARGRMGLCAAHSALVQDECVHGGGSLGPSNFQNLACIKPDNAKEFGFKVFPEMGTFEGASSSDHSKYLEVPIQNAPISLPEGRVHGGSLMSMLVNNAAQFGILRSPALTAIPEKGTFDLNVV